MGVGKLISNSLPKLDNILLVKGLRVNLISISQLSDQGLKVDFSKNECLVTNDKGELLMKGTRSEDNCYLWVFQETTQPTTCPARQEDEAKLWPPKLTIEEEDICGEGQINKQIQKIHLILQRQVTSKDHDVEPYVDTSVSKPEDSRLIGYVFDGNKDNWKSTSGVCFSLHNNLISGFNEKQSFVALSTAKTEYGTDESNCSQLFEMKQMMNEHNVKQDGLTSYCDNKSPINISKNPIQNSRTKHIDVCHNFIREDTLVTLKNVATENQLVDIFIKTLDASKYEALRGKLGIFLLDDQ
ncbi:hypothetical protein QL285_032308 [Trifolium repens]|nr:hypothetical protein QL285_032308 [Trifolium repens]